MRVFDLAGKHVRDVPLPGLGSVGGFGGRRDDSETFYSFTSYTVARLDLSLRREDRREQRSSASRRSISTRAQFETKQVFYQQQGRHARADDDRQPQGTRSSTAATRRSSTATAGSTSR